MKIQPTVLAVFASLAPTAAIAQDDIDDEIIVFGQLEETTPLKLARLGNRVEVITADEIRLGGYVDVAQVLQMRVPGLYLAPKNGAFDYMGCSLQGSRCQDILWLIDGVRINNRLYNSTAPLDTVPAHMIERIEVLYGGQGIFYGTQSVAGVVNIVTKPFSDELTGSVALGINENDGFHANGELRNSFDRHSVSLYASVDDADGFQPFADADYQPSGTDRDRGYEVRTAGIKYGAALSDSSKLTLQYHHTDNKVEWAAPASRSRSFNERDEELVTAKLDLRIGNNVDLYAKGYYHAWDSRWTRIDNELDANGQLTGDTTVISDREYWGYDDYGLTIVGDIRTSGRVDFSLGYEHQRYSGRDDVLLIADQTEKVNALFAQVRTSESWSSTTQLALGVRHNQPSGDGNITVWNASGKHTLSNGIYLRGTAGTAFRFPDAWQLYGNDPCCTLGNPDLEGEESLNINLAVGGQAGADFAWELVVFSRKIDNLIGSANGVRVNTNRTVDFDGVEISGNWSLTNEWQFALDYTHTTAEEKGTSNQVDEVPEDLFKAALTYGGTELPLSVNVSASYVGDVYDSVSGGIGRVEHGGYTVVDMSASWFLGDGRRHRLGLRVENALDEDYATSLGRAFRDADGSSYAYTNLGTPRTIHASYRYSF